MEQNNDMVLFEDRKIRQVESEGHIWFSIVDIIGILTDSPNHQTYWYVLKKREPQLLTICKKLKLVGADGKSRPSDCANTEGVLRLIQSVPSPKAEPFKTWMASLGKQAIDEAANPELITERQTEIYRAKGYPEEWITRRLQTIETRKALTDEWKKRGVKEGQEYSILTAEIAKATFGLTPSEHAKVKGLEKQNLRDHMNRLELIFTALSEETTRTIAERDDAQGFNENHNAAQRGGNLVGDTRRNFEAKEGIKVVSKANFLGLKSEENAKKGLDTEGSLFKIEQPITSSNER